MNVEPVAAFVVHRCCSSKQCGTHSHLNVGRLRRRDVEEEVPMGYRRFDRAPAGGESDGERDRAQANDAHVTSVRTVLLHRVSPVSGG